MLLAVPLLVGFATSVTLANPFLEVAQGFNHEVFALTDREKVEGAKHVHTHELRLRMDAAIGRSPPISEWEMQVRCLHSACCSRRALGEFNIASGSHWLCWGTTAAWLHVTALAP